MKQIFIEKIPQNEPTRSKCIGSIHGAVKKTWFFFVLQFTMAAGFVHFKHSAEPVRVFVLKHFTLVTTGTFIVCHRINDLKKLHGFSCFTDGFLLKLPTRK